MRLLFEILADELNHWDKLWGYLVVKNGRLLCEAVLLCFRVSLVSDLSLSELLEGVCFYDDGYDRCK